MEEIIEKRGLTIHSPIKIERPAPRLWGRTKQRVRSICGVVRIQPSDQSLLSTYEKVFPELFCLYESLAEDTRSQPSQLRAEMSCSVQQEFELKGCIGLYQGKQPIEQVEWQICPCNDGTDLVVTGSVGLLTLLVAYQPLGSSYCYLVSS